MAYIKVDHKKFENAAAAIDTYITNHKAKMAKIDGEMSDLAASWQGADYSAVRTQWEGMKGPGSTSDNMLKSLNSYAQYLRLAGKTYQEAQSRAVNRANKL